MKKTLNTLMTRTLKKQFKDLFHLIKKSKGILIAGHINPDGDDICSQLAVSEFLESINKKYLITWGEDVPKSFHFLPNVSRITSILKTAVDPQDYDMMLVVDSGDIDRIGDVRKLIRPGMKVANLDHHKGNTRFGDFNIVVDKASSIGELLYYFFKENRVPITFNMAVDLYISIITDSGSFRYDNMHPSVHYIAGELLELGVVPSEYYMALNMNKTSAYIKLLTKALSRMELFENGRISVSTLSVEDFHKIDIDETDGIIEYLGMLESVSVYILIKEKSKNNYSASLRSKTIVDVAKVASYFNGGGHRRAAGCKTDKLTGAEFRDKLIELVKEQLD
jgi:bifunctional oligoribonuclease and PAP phosphatase NrnA